MFQVGLLARIVHTRPGITFNELLAEGFFASELAPALGQLCDMREIRRDGARFYPRSRRKKLEPPPTFWSRLAGLFRGN